MSHRDLTLSLSSTSSWGAWLERTEAARDLGFGGVRAIPGDLAEDLPEQAMPGFLNWLPISLFCEESEDESDLKELLDDGLIRRLLLALRTYQAKGVVLSGLHLTQSGAIERGQRLLAHLREEGSPPAKEGTEVLETEFSSKAEQDLERLARFLHQLRLRAPALAVALVAEPNPAGLLTPDRLNLLIEEGGFSGIHYWHDSGRCETRANLGLDHPGEWLDRFAGIAAGATLNDWQAGTDLKLPGEGCVDFQLVGEYLPRTAERVLHVAPLYPRGLLPAAADALAAAGL